MRYNLQSLVPVPPSVTVGIWEIGTPVKRKLHTKTLKH